MANQSEKKKKRASKLFVMYRNFLFTFANTYRHARITEGPGLFLARCSGSGYIYINTNSKCGNDNRENDDGTDLFVSLPSESLPSCMPLLDFWFLNDILMWILSPEPSQSLCRINSHPLSLVFRAL